MTAVALHTEPRWPVFAREQILAVGLFMRRTGVLLLVMFGAGVWVCVFMAVQSIAMRATNPHAAHVNFTYSPAMSVLVMLIGFFLPFGVWQDEDPRHRSYHWMMPVARHTHTLTKVFGGWVWLMAATLLYLIVAILIVVITERITGEPQSYGRAFAAWEWLVPFAAGTVAYLFVSAATVGSRQPIGWIVVVIALYLLLIYSLAMVGYPQAAKKVLSLYDGEYGARAAMMGRIEAFDAVHRQAYSSLTRWLGSTAIWGAIGGGLLVGTAHRRPSDV